MGGLSRREGALGIEVPEAGRRWCLWRGGGESRMIPWLEQNVHDGEVNPEKIQRDRAGPSTPGDGMRASPKQQEKHFRSMALSGR